MTTTELEKTAAPPDVNAQTAAILVALATQARAARRPTLVVATIDGLAAVIVWASSYWNYAFDSATSFLLCAVILVALFLPAGFLLWVWRSLCETTKLPAKFLLPSQELPGDGTVVETDQPGSPLTRWGWRLARRVDAAWKVWSSLEYFNAIDSVGGPRCFLWFLARPASQIVVGLALLASVGLVLVALVQIVLAVVGGGA